MNQSEAIKLIHKYIQDNLSEEEMKNLLIWLKKPENKQVFDEQIEINHLLLEERKVDAAQAYKEIEAYLKPVKNKNKWPDLLKYAAIFIGILSVGYYFFNTDSLKSDPDFDFITLERDNGEMEIIDQENHQSIVSSKGEVIGTKQANSLTYHTDSSATELVYNTLHVPKGRTFQLNLSDGTQITLNADSKITYPINFLPDRKREVKLKGEAYFKVAKDSLHQFVVNAEDQNVEVYGTTFNVKAYPDETANRTVLVEGSVGVFTSSSQVKLIPGEMAVTLKGGEVKVEEVNPDDYTAWVEDKLIFQAEEFAEIIKILERKFDIKIDNKYKDLDQQKFTASFNEKNIEQILQLFAKSRSFQFNIKDKQVTISKPDKQNTMPSIEKSDPNN